MDNTEPNEQDTELISKTILITRKQKARLTELAWRVHKNDSEFIRDLIDREWELSDPTPIAN